MTRQRLSIRRPAPSGTRPWSHRRGNMPMDILMSLAVITITAIALYFLAEQALRVLFTIQDLIAGWPYR